MMESLSMQYSQELFQMTVVTLVAILVVVSAQQGHVDIMNYGRQCSGYRCADGTFCNVDVTLFREQEVTSRRFCNTGSDILQTIMDREGLCKVLDLTNRGGEFHGSGAPCRNNQGVNFVCDKQEFYLTVNNVWYLAYKCIPVGEPCATKPLVNGHCSGRDVQYYGTCSQGQACVRHVQNIYSRERETGLKQYACQSVCKVIQPVPNTLGNTTYHSTCPDGLVCTRQLRDVHYKPDCTPVQAYQCEPWSNYLNQLVASGYFRSLYRTNEPPCMVVDAKTQKYHHIYQCYNSAPCIRYQVPESASSPYLVNEHYIDSQTSFHAYYCDNHAISAMTEHVQLTMVNDKGIYYPGVCKIIVHSVPGQNTIHSSQCGPWSECVEIAHTYFDISLHHTVYTPNGRGVVQSKRYTFSAWGCKYYWTR